MKKMNNKAIAGIGLIAILAVGGTFAYYNQTLSLDNPLSTGHYENQLVEEYTPPTDELIPGTTLDKVVGAVNTGDYPVLVRIKMDEKWEKAIEDDNGEITPQELNALSSKSAEFEAVKADITTYPEDEYDSPYKFPYVTENQHSGDNDGQVEGDGSVVRKNLTDDISDDSSDWVYGNDGYWYYNGVLEANGGETGKLINSITLASNIDLGVYLQKDYYYVGASQPAADSTDWIEYWVTRDNDGWVTDIELSEGTFIGDLNLDGIINAIDMAMALNLSDSDTLYRKNESLLDESNTGYADATYTLVITSEFVQASSDAVDAIWTDTSAATIENLINIEADSDGIYSTGSASADTGSVDDNTEETEAETDAATE